jgi:hypothetical protein
VVLEHTWFKGDFMRVYKCSFLAMLFFVYAFNGYVLLLVIVSALVAESYFQINLFSLSYSIYMKL